jgi:NAD(P)-dependent dehydrogenase (short-subunit alcohol dehydrogenase family)
VSGWDLSGRTVLVTGGSKGIGRGMAGALAEAGARVIVTARSADGAQAAADAIGRGARGLAYEAASGEAGAEALAEAAGPVDAVFLNAGAVEMRAALETDEALFDALTAANLKAVFFGARAFGRRMLDRGHGKIVAVASDIGVRGAAGWSAYAATKGGVIALAKSLAWEWAPKVTVNVIAPGPFDTPANAPAFSAPGVLDWLKQEVPLGLVGQPAEHLGPLAVLLAGPGSDFMTGVVVKVSGGIGRY